MGFLVDTLYQIKEVPFHSYPSLLRVFIMSGSLILSSTFPATTEIRLFLAEPVIVA